jgi:sulfopyruvate decarboxylase TPP-binding subunit
MWQGQAVADALVQVGVTHIVWIPDSHLGTWTAAFTGHPQLRLVRVCREGEAIAVAVGLHLGGQRPIVMMQCTGFFEAGDAFRNAIHDMQVPLFLVVGVRSWHAHQQGRGSDTCPIYTEPILKAWQIPYDLIDPERHTPADLANAYRRAHAVNRAGAVLLAE